MSELPPYRVFDEEAFLAHGGLSAAEVGPLGADGPRPRPPRTSRVRRVVRSLAAWLLAAGCGAALGLGGVAALRALAGGLPGFGTPRQPAATDVVGGSRTGSGGGLRRARARSRRDATRVGRMPRVPAVPPRPIPRAAAESAPTAAPEAAAPAGAPREFGFEP